MRALALSDITSPVDQVTTIPFLLEGDTVEYYHSLTKVVQDDWFELMRVLGQRFGCISHKPVYLSKMLTCRESEFPRHADYIKEFRTCVINSKVNTTALQMGNIVNSRFVEGLSNDAVRRQVPHAALGAARVGRDGALPGGPGPPAPQRDSRELPPLAGGGGWMPHATWEAMLPDVLHPQGVRPHNLLAPQKPPVRPEAPAGDPPRDATRTQMPVRHHSKPNPAHTHPLATPQASTRRHWQHPQHPESAARHTARRA